MSKTGDISVQVDEAKQDSHSLKPKRLAFLDSLRAIAIIMVVGVHSLGYCLELPHDIKQVISFIVHTISVPIFFLVDGYLFARSVVGLRTYTYAKYIPSSLLRLLVPWTVFTLAYTLARYAFELTGFLKEQLIVGHPLHEVAISAYGSVYAPQLYFLCSLFLIRLCSPIFVEVLSSKNYYLLPLLFCIYYTAYRLIKPIASAYLTINGGQEPVLHALWGIQFYVLGIIVFKTSDVMDLRKLFGPFLLLFILALMAKYIFQIDELLYLNQYLYLLTMFLFFTFYQNGFHLLNALGKNTMGIYLIHAPIALKAVSLIVIKFALDPILSFVSVFIGTLVLSICLVKAINCVPYGCLLFGTPYRRPP